MNIFSVIIGVSDSSEMVNSIESMLAENALKMTSGVGHFQGREMLNALGVIRCSWVNPNDVGLGKFFGEKIDGDLRQTSSATDH